MDLTEGFLPIAVRDDRAGNTVISFNPDTREFLLSVSGKLAGPFKLTEIKALIENLRDVIEMKGRYLYIEDYDARGNRTR